MYQNRPDAYTILKDILHDWLFVVLVALIAFFASFSWQYLTYRPTYTMTVTFTVGSKTALTDVYSNLTSTASAATQFEQILNSSILQKKVAEQIGMDYMPGNVSATTVEGTNVMELTVVETNPKLSYLVLNAILDNYSTVSDSLMGNVVLTTLSKDEIPVNADKSFNPLPTMFHRMWQGALGAIIFLGILSFFRDTVKKEEEVEEKVDGKLIGTLGHEKKYEKFRLFKKRQKTAILITNSTISFHYIESMKKIGAKVTRFMDKRHAQTLLVTSVLENEGKSTVSANLALALAQGSKKVLLMDGDLRKPAVYKIFDVNNDDIVSFGEVLKGNGRLTNALMTVEGTTLDILINKEHYPDSTELLALDEMVVILDYLKTQYDYIVIDSSPIAMVADSQVLLDLADAAVLVIRQHKAHVRDINDAIDLINRTRLKLAGCIFNDATQGSNALTYGAYGNYGYGSYGNYGYGTYADYSQRSSVSKKHKNSQGGLRDEVSGITSESDR